VVILSNIHSKLGQEFELKQWRKVIFESLISNRKWPKSGRKWPKSGIATIKKYAYS